MPDAQHVERLSMAAVVLATTAAIAPLPAVAGGSICSGGSGTADYCVYAMPVEAPHNTTPLPPGDGRTMVTAPWLAAAGASPFGWHDTDGVPGAEFTITRGNNVHAFDAGDNPGFSPDGGANLVFNFPIGNVDGDDPDTYEAASITQVFYWINVLHDVLYEHGFDEAAGNYQENNYGLAGAGGDAIDAEVQSLSGMCGGTFSTPADGARPRLVISTCNVGGTERDGALDNGVITYLYWLGVTQRLTGGPANVSCQSNAETAIVGWSDYGALIMTIEPGDAGTDARGFGTWFFGQGPDGPGVRDFPYSTDLGVDPRTYGDVATAAAPFDTGSIFATALWEMTWALINAHGFNPNLYQDWMTGGNNLALRLVLDGLARQPCNPGFVDARDAILQAELTLTGGLNQCLLWSAFAKRGLGASADQGSANSVTDGTEAFDLPPECAPIFADGFESGDTSAWSTAVP
jgi:extracellular elastinolytic metalloproteinase